MSANRYVQSSTNPEGQNGLGTRQRCEMRRSLRWSASKQSVRNVSVAWKCWNANKTGCLESLTRFEDSAIDSSPKITFAATSRNSGLPVVISYYTEKQVLNQQLTHQSRPQGSKATHIMPKISLGHIPLRLIAASVEVKTLSPTPSKFGATHTCVTACNS